MNMQRPKVRMNIAIVATRSEMAAVAATEIGLSVKRNRPARPSAIAVHITVVCRGVAQRGEAEHDEQRGKEHQADFRRGVGEAGAQPPCTAPTAARQIMVLEAFVETERGENVLTATRARPQPAWAGAIMTGIVPA